MNKSQQKRFDSLYQQHLNALIRQGKASNTVSSYARAVRRITKFHDQCPDRLTEDHLKSYFDSLIKSHSWSTVKVDRNGLQFFYKHVLKKDWKWVEIIKPPRKRTLPDILSRKEVAHVINHTNELRYQTFILTTYSMGLRLGETLNLQVKDIDSARMLVHVRQGKGRKDRLVILPQRTLIALRSWWATHRNRRWLFPSGKSPSERSVASKTMDRGGLQRSFKTIIADCGIHKAITVHSLRHCYGAHLLESGVHLRTIQMLMGHESPKTTSLYTQVSKEAAQDSDLMINQMVNQMRLQWAQEVDHDH